MTGIKTGSWTRRTEQNLPGSSHRLSAKPGTRYRSGMNRKIRLQQLKRAIQGVDEESDRVRRLIQSGEIPSPVAEKLSESLRAQRDKLVDELSALERISGESD